MRSPRAPMRAAAVGIGVLALSVLSCGREAVAPASDGVSLARHGAFAFEPVFPRAVNGASLAGAVEFEKVRVVLHRADGSIALDTVVLFPPGSDSVAFTADVPLAPTTPGTGEVFKLDLGYMNSTGDVVFKGGPVDLTVVPKGSNTTPPPIQIPVQYSGPGASATKIVVSPKSVSVFEGQAFSFSAVATDATGTPIPNTPIVWAALDPTRAVLNSSSAGAGHALALRGDARVVAQLLTGPADTGVVSVMLVARNIAMQSGDAQKGVVSKALAQPLVVKVTAGDGVPVAGATVAFAVATGAGSVAGASATTDAGGLASTIWTLGPGAGTQTVSASASGLLGSPITFTATARSVAPAKLVFADSPLASNTAGSPLRITINALDAQGDLAKDFAGSVTVALGPTSPAAPLNGTLTATAVAGVATFSNVRINLPNTGYVLTASTSGLGSATSGSFAVVPGSAQHLEFGAYPVFGSVAGVLDGVAVIARDAVGNVATSFTGPVSLGLLAGSSSDVAGTLRRAAVAGVATFDDLSITRSGNYQFGATADGVTAVTGPAFSIRAGPAFQLLIVTGSGQSANAGSALPRAITAAVVDRLGNTVPSAGVAITFSASNGGSASPSSGNTNSGGEFATSWTLGGVGGIQTLTASSGSLGSATVSAIAVAGAVSGAGGGDLVVIDDVNWADNGLGLTMSGAVFLNPGNEKFVRNLVSFSTSGARSAANKVLLVNDRGNSDYIFTSNWSNFGSLLTSLGLTTTQTTLHSAFAPVANDVKLVIIHTPSLGFTTAQINGLRTFASEGGRILFIGENGGYYPYQSVENAFIFAMGSPMTSVGSCAAPGELVTSISHALTAGIATSGAGGFYMNCASYHTGHGTGDVALMKDASNRVVVSVLKVNYGTYLPSLMAPLRAQRIVAPEPIPPTALLSPDRTAVPPRRP